MKSSTLLRSEQASRISSNDYAAKSKHAEWQVPVLVDSRPLVSAALATGAPLNPITEDRIKCKKAMREAHLKGNDNPALAAVEQGMRDLEKIRKGEQVGS